MIQSSEPITHQLSDSEALPGLVKDILGKGGDCRLEVRGFSMSPSIKDGDVVTISPMSDASPGFGDVIAFVHPKAHKFIIHRVVRKVGDGCLVKGENALEPDGLIERNDIMGIITNVERKGQKVFFGLGPERFLIALLTRANLLLPVVGAVSRMVRPVARIFLK